MTKQEATDAIGRGRLSKVGYGILSHGHLAVLVNEPNDKNELRLFSSHSFKGPNIDEDIDTLASHSWDA